MLTLDPTHGLHVGAFSRLEIKRGYQCINGYTNTRVFFRIDAEIK